MTAHRHDFDRPYRHRRRGPSGARGGGADNLGLAVVVVAAAAFLGAIFAPGGPINDGTSPRTSPGTSPEPVYYPNCRDARAAGAAPIHEGEPGYRPDLDGDGDGTACEPFRER